MAQIKVKQIKLVAQGDLVVANSSSNGSILSVGTTGQVVVSNGTTPLWGQVGAAGISLTEGDVFIGDATNVAAEASATVQGQVIVSGAGPNFDLAVGTLAAEYVTFAPNTSNNIVATNVQNAIVEVAAEHVYIHTATVDPVANNDGVDTGTIGVDFKIGDIWINTATDNVWHVVDVSTGAAVWARSAGIASAFVYKGDLDASDAGDSLPSSPVAGDWYRISASTGTQNFNGTWDASGDPNGATFDVGDAIVFGDDGDWHKIDNTDPVIANSGDGILVTGGPTTYTVNVDADETTITATGGGGNEVTVYGGLTNQVLVGQGASSDATWNYVDNLYDSNGNIIVDGVGSATPVNNLRITSADTGGNVGIETIGTDLNIDLDITAKNTGRISLDGTSWPAAVAPIRSIPIAVASGDLDWISAPDGGGDQVLIYNDATNLFEWTVASNIGGPAWGTINADSGSSIADTTSDTITISGGVAIITTATDDPETLTIDFNIPELTAETVIDPAVDYVVVYDASAVAHRKVLITNLPGGAGGGNDVDEDEVTATGSANEVFVAFFSNTPVSDSVITVFFNGLRLKTTGWSRSGTTLTMVDAVNGYATESGDVISARYEF